MRAAGAILLGKTNVNDGSPVYARPNNPHDARALAGREQQRRGGDHRGGRIAAGARERFGREHPAAGGVVRCRGAEADERTGAEHRPLSAHRADARSAHDDRADGAAASKIWRWRCASSPARTGAIRAWCRCRSAMHPPLTSRRCASPGTRACRARRRRRQLCAPWARRLACFATRAQRWWKLRRRGSTSRCRSRIAYWSRVQSSSLTEWAPSRASTLTADEIERSIFEWARFRASMLRFMEDYDVIVCPATADVAPEHRALTGDDYVYMLPYSLTGYPVVVVRCGEDGGMPVACRSWRGRGAIMWRWLRRVR